MAYQIKRKGPAKADLLTEDKYEDAIHRDTVVVP